MKVLKSAVVLFVPKNDCFCFPKIKSIESDNRVDDSREDRVKSTLNPIFKKNSILDYKPLILTTPRPTGKDPLIKIKGINSKIEVDLNLYH